MKKAKSNISIFELSKICSQQELIMNAWKEETKCFAKEKSVFFVNLVKYIISLTNGKETIIIATFNKISTSLNNAILGKKSKSMTPPFLLTFEIFNMNIHNFLVDYDMSSNIKNYVIAKNINAKLKKMNTQIIQLD